MPLPDHRTPDGLPHVRIMEQVEGLRTFAASAVGMFAMMPLTEQRDATHEAAMAAADAFIRDPSGDPMETFYRLGHLSHTRDLPGYALTILLSQVLDEDTARDLILFSWRIPEWPEANGGTDAWRLAWQLAGYCADDDVPQPTKPTTLWRGAIPRHKRGMAWTGDRDKAVWFRDRFGTSLGGVPRLYEATVDPSRVYARLVGRHEDEYVVDTRALPIRTVGAGE